MKKFIFLLYSLLFVVFVESLSGQTDLSKPIIKTPVYFDISPALRDIKTNAPGPADLTWKDGVVKNFFNFKNHHPDSTDLINGADPNMQTDFGMSPTAITGQNFDGISNTMGYVPPDTDGDVGPNHFFQVVNCQYKIFNKTGTGLYGPVPSSTMWNGLPNNSNSGDAIVLYDEQADRWFFSQFSLPNFPNGPFYMMIAVSQTADPLGSWYRWQYAFTDMPDYPKFGIWPDGYYMSINRFTAGLTNWNGIGAVAFNRAAMLAGNASPAMVMFTLPAGNEAGSMLPSDCDGAFPVTGTPNYFTFINDSPDHLVIYEFHVDWTTPASSTFGNSLTLAVNSFSSIIGTGIPQPGTTRKLDDLADRLMFRLQYRTFSDHAAMVTNHSVNANVGGSNNAGVRWYELRKTTGAWNIYQQATYAPDTKYRWMGSLAMDASGNIALGYSVSDASSTYPSIRYTGRMVNDPLNQMTLTENSIIAGGGSQTHSSGRWGDYSSMLVDPSAPNTFWYTTEYYSITSSTDWKTRIASLSFSSGFVPGTVAASQNICYNTTPALLTATSPTGGTPPYSYQWQNSPDNQIYSNIPGATSLNYQPGALTSTTWYRQVQSSSGGGGTANTNAITIMVYQNFVVGSISANQSICYNATPSALTGTAPAGGNMPYSYQWQSSPNNSAFSNIPGATSLNYQPGSLTATTWFRQVQTSAGCGSGNTNVITIAVSPGFAVGSISTNQNVCYNTTPALLTGTSPTGGNMPYTYQWQSSPNNGVFSSIPGASSLNYQPGSLTATTWFRQVQTSAGCGSGNTNVITITVYPNFVVGSISANQHICYNATPAILTGTAPTGGNAPYIYQWQSSSNSDVFSDIQGATSLNYQPGNLIATKWYRQTQIATVCGSDSTNVIAVVVYPNLLPGVISSNQNICYNAVPALLTGTAPTGGNTPYTYQWQVSPNNSSFTNISGATGLTYQPGALTATRYYRLVQTSAGNCGSVNTNVVIINVYPGFLVGSIAANQTINYNTVPATLTGSAPTGGVSPYAYQWYSSTNGTTFNAIGAATNLNYSPGALTATTWYKQIQSSAGNCGSFSTNIVLITVNPPPVITVTSPNGGEDWLQGSTCVITWTDNITENVKINLFKGGVYLQQIVGSTPSTGTYTWTIHANQQTGTDYKINIVSTTDNSVYDFSNADFTITRVVPLTLVIQNSSVENGQSLCYDATQTIFVAGNGTSYVVQSGGNAIMIAGQNILYYSGTHVQLGGSMHGYISPGGPWCSAKAPSIPAVVSGVEDVPFFSSDICFKVYPNPTTGNFTLEQMGEKMFEKVNVEVYSMLGDRVLKVEMIGEKMHEFSLSDAPVGIYFIRMLAGEKPVTIKIIKQ